MVRLVRDRRGAARKVDKEERRGMAERGGGGFYSEANGSKEIKEHSLHEKLPRRNIVCEVREAETR